MLGAGIGPPRLWPWLASSLLPFSFQGLGVMLCVIVLADFYVSDLKNWKMNLCYIINIFCLVNRI